MMPLVFFAGRLQVEMQAKVFVVDFVEMSNGEASVVCFFSPQDLQI